MLNYLSILFLIRKKENEENININDNDIKHAINPIDNVIFLVR